MALKKLLFKPGINKEATRYATEGGWYDCDKIRFRNGFPEKIGGWTRKSENTFLGVCRSLWSWTTTGGLKLIGAGTNLKFYIDQGGEFFDVTPIRLTTSPGDITFTATPGDSRVLVNHTAHGATTGSFVTYSSAVSLGGAITVIVIENEFAIDEVVDVDSYYVDFGVAATAGDTGNGSGVIGAYQINIGPEVPVPVVGWGSGGFGLGTWSTGSGGTERLRLWNQANFGEDLVFGPKGGGIYYWDASNSVTTRGVALSSLGGASDVPTVQNLIFVSDNRFVFTLGTNIVGSSAVDPMLIRWSDQEDATNWTPAATNQAGSLRFSRGSEIVAVRQARQEVLIWTDVAVYSLQYLGAPEVWGAQLLGDNISVINQNAVVYVQGQAFWMGKDDFYYYDGRVQPLPCDLSRYIFDDLNFTQARQVFAGINEGFTEIWWFYCSEGSTTIDRYVIYNYGEQIWYYGSLARTAWVETGLEEYPIAATYSNNLVYHELGVDDAVTATPQAIDAYITSSDFDIDDGDKFSFVRRMLPDITFSGSTIDSPAVTLTLTPLKGSGSGYNSPASEGGNSSAAVTRSATVPVEQFTDQIYLRIRGRQLVFKIESDAVGVQWQLGAPRIDLRPDGRR
jgi:hypothetical protein